MADEQVFSVTQKRFANEDPRLGRHVLHDSRSKQYRFLAKAAPRKLASVRHKINIPILDQLNVGSCCGHAGTANIAADAFWSMGQTVLKNDAQADHDYAVRLYSAATVLDPWEGQYEPDDTGTDGLSIAKVLQRDGLISGYQHAMTMNDALAALAIRPVLVGTTWLSGMYDPASDGRLSVTGRSVGGHEYCLDELDVERQRVWLRNSWGESWGVKGRAYIAFADFAKLLADLGDCTVLIPKEEPAPQPTPAPTPSVDVTANARAVLTKFMKTRNVPSYVRHGVEPWLKGQS